MFMKIVKCSMLAIVIATFLVTFAEIELFKCTTIMKEEREKNNMNSQKLDILTKFLMWTMINYGERKSIF